ncbi:hypothetical protein ACFFX0_17520 [Citricoccus parietis]|uniref:Uncharacterized protein n=1 Tax=Citricoccus parietis TaxID=592307 RepID=A0ABV5G1V8_9MICC
MLDVDHGDKPSRPTRHHREPSLDVAVAQPSARSSDHPRRRGSRGAPP